MAGFALQLYFYYFYMRGEVHDVKTEQIRQFQSRQISRIGKAVVNAFVEQA